ncbi:MAG: type II toxin-antitoxin system VapB family antitoxin [Endomicrobium sp.]|jgi:Arc/MetJ family transcription regulator|nr:type II toxin-antitoxin system VapB family antitoxin [Endomicrobium sp.]
MRTTLDLPEQLINKAMALTHISTKTEVIKIALENLIEREKLKN